MLDYLQRLIYDQIIDKDSNKISIIESEIAILGIFPYIQPIKRPKGIVGKILKTIVGSAEIPSPPPIFPIYPIQININIT